MKKILLLAVAFLVLYSSSAFATGTFERLVSSVTSFGYKFSKTINGFDLYEKDDVTLFMRNCNNDICEGMITAPPMSDEDLADKIMPMYLAFQTVLDSPVFTNNDDELLLKHTDLLVNKVMVGLKNKNKTEFTYDGLKVRGEVYPVSKKEKKSGKKPMLLIKLWIP